MSDCRVPFEGTNHLHDSRSLHQRDPAKTSSNMQTENIPERPKSAAKAKKEKPSKQPKGPTTAKPTRAAASKPVVEDPEAMFKVGFLSDVYQERPKGHGGVTNIITRVLVLLFDTCDGCLNDL